MTPELEVKIAKILHHVEEANSGFDAAIVNIKHQMRDPAVMKYLDEKRAAGVIPPPRLRQSY